MRPVNTHIQGRAGLAATIRRQLGTTVNRSLLSHLPAFALQQEPLPEALACLLDELDGAEMQGGSPIAPGNREAGQSAPGRQASVRGRSRK